MPIYRIQQTIATVDNVNANYATNTWHFQGDDTSVFSPIVSAMVTFYNAVRPQMSALVRQNTHPYKIYDLADPEPRAPLVEGSWNFSSAPSGNPLPTEVSLCVSFQALKVSGEPQARRRGRIYLPFFNVSAIGSDGRPASGTITAVQSAADAFLTTSKAATTWQWIIRSPLVVAGGSVVENGWIDNEWDTQRRRGRVPVTRSVFV